MFDCVVDDIENAVHFNSNSQDPYFDIKCYNYQ